MTFGVSKYFFSEVHAQTAVDPVVFGKVLDPIISNIVYPVIWVLFAFGIFVFAFGIVEMIIKGDNADARKQGQKHMLAGVFGMFIMISAWGIIRLIASTIKGI
ncbi:MAG: hypothetical protein AAB777_02330 [Patescibacteria group bacterium]